MRKMMTAMQILALGLITLPTMAADWKPAQNTIMTPWAKKVDPASPLPEYPRPQMIRKQWVNLNGLWQYEITAKGAKATNYDGQILVPFCIESALSGVRKPLTPQDQLWYRRHFDAPDLAGGKRLLLHFGAVDWESTVWVNGIEIGTHRGGYDPFSYDISKAVKPGDNELIVSVWDPSGTNGAPRGKQNLPSMTKPGGIMYTPCSGIWQTVWLEPAPGNYIDSLTITPDLDQKRVRIHADVSDFPAGGMLKVEALLDGEVIASATKIGPDVGLVIDSPKLWTPENPTLYDLRVTLLEQGSIKPTADHPDVVADSVTSYFAFRKIALGQDEKGITRIMLNNKPVFMAGPLDQGFWPDGIYTAPTDDALKYDIEITKKLGFNATRKHVKVEPDRWYYWCDKLGLLVWQDMPAGGVVKNSRASDAEDKTANASPAAKQFESELTAMITTHRNHPCIVMWVVFNEGWGQYETARLTEWTKNTDPTRLVSNTSGWTDRGVGDVIDMHNYPGPGSPKPEAHRAAVLGEFGGLGLSIEGHQWVKESWGYRNMSGNEGLNRKYIELWRGVWQLKNDPGLCGAIYTQLTDVETESNGLLTYDRKVIKVDVEKTATAIARGQFPPEPVYAALVPTSESAPQNWKYTFEKPSADWFQPSFGATAWKEGPGGFGHKTSSAGNVRTEWKTDDIWLRREVSLTASPTGDVLLRLYHDDDAEVYFNGVLAAKAPGYIDGYELTEIRPEALAALKAGSNLIAVHCHQVKGGQFIDVGLVREGK